MYSQTRTVQIRQIVLFVLLKKFAKERAKTAELKGKALMLDIQMLKNEMEKNRIIIINHHHRSHHYYYQYYDYYYYCCCYCCCCHCCYYCIITWETYTRHLNHETNRKCSKTLQEITNQYWVTENALFTVTQLDIQKVYKMIKFCPRRITDSTVPKTHFPRL